MKNKGNIVRSISALGVFGAALVVGIMLRDEQKDPISEAPKGVPRQREHENNEPQNIERDVESPSAPVAVQENKLPSHGERKFFPRDPLEWQGYLVESEGNPPCNEFDSCGRGKACLDGICSPCEVDDHCDDGEACVLNNCLLKDKVECRTRHDCLDEQLCIFVDDRSAYSWRGNASLIATCSDSALAQEIVKAQIEKTGDGSRGIVVPNGAREEPKFDEKRAISELSKLAGRSVTMGSSAPEVGTEDE